MVFRDRLSRVYAADLAGAGVGAAASVGGPLPGSAERALDFVCGLGAVAGALAVWGRGRSPSRRSLLLLCGVVLALSGFGVTGELRISPFSRFPRRSGSPARSSSRPIPARSAP